MNHKGTAFAVALLAPFLLAMSNPGIPKLLHYEHADAFAWIAESEAFDKAGNLRAELFGPFAESLKLHMAKNRDGTCHAFMIQSVPERPLSDRSLSEASATARSIITGRVINTERGFYGALPGTLVGVHIARVLTPPEGKQKQKLTPDVVYIFIPSAAFVTPAGALCSESLTNISVPDIGDQVMAFSFDRPNDERELILPVYPDRELIVERNGVRILTPAQLKVELTGLRLDDIATRVRRYASERQREK